MTLAHFRKHLHSYLGLAKKNQKTLAALLLMYPNVLSWKLNYTHKAKSTGNEVRQLILILTRWHCFTFRNEIGQFLEPLHFTPLNIFAQKDRLLPPLAEIEVVAFPPNSPANQMMSGSSADTIALTLTSPNRPATITPRANNIPGLIGRKSEISEIIEIGALLTQPDTPPISTLTGPSYEYPGKG